MFYLVAWGFQKFFGGEEEKAPDTIGPVTFELKDDSIVRGNLAVFEIENQSNQALKFTSPCESEKNTLRIFRVVNGQKVAVSDFENCDPENVPGFTVQPEGKMPFSLREYNDELFSEEGVYTAEIILDRPETDALTLESEPFEFNDPGMFRQLFRAIISRPLFNLLVFFTQTLPGHPFGWSIVILTLLVRALLFMPNQKAMRSQRRLQKLQPKIAELREKHKGDQQAIAMKTMELYKSQKVSPMSSCLPMLLQLPILLGLYYIVRDGLSPHLSYLLYSFQQGVDLSVVNTQFLGLNLNERNMILLPIIVGVAQWIAIRMSLISAKKRTKKEAKKSEKKVDKKPATSPMQMESMNKAMQWVMPLMIGFFAASLPAAVGIYWLTSTIFGIGQQKLVNWQLDRPQVVRKKES
ncbi:MAG: YidC/Oxa1 family membrane protein insertase [Candidatus Gracilibacteria bacterium]|nr:YidC/Oxa1 family membrane protein insertase [Candidatus Gracilibacteria bacterium]